MSNPIRNQMNNSSNNMMSMFNQFRQNPIQFLIQRHINIPQEYQNNPKEAVQYLMNNGQLSQDNFNKLSQMASNMGVKLN